MTLERTLPKTIIWSQCCSTSIISKLLLFLLFSREKIPAIIFLIKFWVIAVPVRSCPSSRLMRNILTSFPAGLLLIPLSSVYYYFAFKLNGNGKNSAPVLWLQFLLVSLLSVLLLDCCEATNNHGVWSWAFHFYLNKMSWNWAVFHSQLKSTDYSEHLARSHSRI